MTSDSSPPLCVCVCRNLSESSFSKERKRENCVCFVCLFVCLRRANLIIIKRDNFSKARKED